MAGSLWGRLMATTSAATMAWRTYGEPLILPHDARYQRLWAFYSGTWRYDPRLKDQHRTAPRLYRHTLLLYNICRAVVRLYAHAVYMGDLSTDGKSLPDGTRGAIPIDPQMKGGAESEDGKRLLLACAELWNMWHWRQYMSIRPKMAAILGDCLTELIDDVDHGKVVPRMIWPGSVVDLKLDDVGNIQRYALEWRVEIPESTAYGASQPRESYVYRKEVDKQFFRYYRDNKPYAYPEYGDAVQENFYGFVPAIWDRHEVVWGDRGMGAFEGALQAMESLNGIFKHALDYQSKQFAAPVGVIGQIISNAGAERRRRRGEPVEDTPPTGGGDVQELIDLVPLEEGGGFMTVEFDIGQTVALLEFWVQSIRSEFPESNYAQEILEMTQVTAPGVERALGPMVSGVKQVRANEDPRTVQLHQMAIAMIGERLRRGDYDDVDNGNLLRDRQARYDIFRPFDLTSYGRGLLDFGISDRPVIPETPMERAQYAMTLQNITDPYLLEMAGVPAEKVATMVAEREKRAQAQFDREARAFNRGDDEPPARPPAPQRRERSGQSDQ